MPQLQTWEPTPKYRFHCGFGQLQMAKTIAIFDTTGNQEKALEMDREGVEVVLVRVPAYEPLITQDDLEILNKRINVADWVVFADPISARSVFLSGLNLESLDGTCVAAATECVANELYLSQVHTDVVSKSFEPRELLEGILSYEQAQSLSQLEIIVFGFESLKREYLAPDEDLGCSIRFFEASRVSGGEIECTRIRMLLDEAESFVVFSEEEMFYLISTANLVNVTEDLASQKILSK